MLIDDFIAQIKWGKYITERIFLMMRKFK